MKSDKVAGRPGYACREGGHVARTGRDLDAYVVDVLLERLRLPDVADLLAPLPPDTGPLHAEADALRVRLDELAAMFADGTVTASQLTEGTGRLRDRLGQIEAQLADAADASALAPFAARDPADVWETLDLQQRRTVLDLLAVVTIHRARKGRPPGWRPGESYFDPSSVEIAWKGQQ